MNTKIKILASALLGVSVLLGGFGTASAATSGDEPNLPPTTMVMGDETYYVRSAREATGGGEVICGPYKDDSTRTVFLCLNPKTKVGVTGVINTEKMGGDAYHIEKGTSLESGDTADLHLKEIKSLKDQKSSLNSQCGALAAVVIILLIIIGSGVYMIRSLRKKNAILEKKAKAYDQLQDLAEGLKTHYPLSSGE
jgi:hypothetical protein|nr:MAG TPA: hypothetical protein [Caudoviricetes sp.]